MGKAVSMREDFNQIQSTLAALPDDSSEEGAFPGPVGPVGPVGYATGPRSTGYNIRTAREMGIERKSNPDAVPFAVKMAMIQRNMDLEALKKEEKKKEIQSKFELLCRGKDVLEKKEFMKMAHIKNSKLPQKQLDQLWKVMDADNNGFLTEEEFQMHYDEYQGIVEDYE